MKRHGWLPVLSVLVVIAFVITAVPALAAEGKKKSSVSEKANAEADATAYKPVEYANKDKAGPKLVVLPGEIKSTDATFTQKVTPNSVADFAEIELSKANFGVLERTDLGPMLDEVTLAANRGDADALKKFKKGKFETTKWFVKFDVLKAEKVAGAKKKASGGVLGSIAGTLIGGKGGAVTSTAGGSLESEKGAEVWLVGVRYKVIDASTSEQVATNYIEQKMETGAKSHSVLGFGGSQEKFTTLDSTYQRLVQDCVAEMDAKLK